ncbi:MAG TPA: hypothetical protein PK095_17690 [Myxococcota bacterium]|nr:hypothetical protein [Myxococcota bacterium]
MLKPLLASLAPLAVLSLTACATAPPSANTPTEHDLIALAERQWRERLAAHDGSDEANTLMAQAPLDRLRDPIAIERRRRLDSASCRLTLDYTTAVLKLDDTPIFFPSTDLNDALADGQLRPELVNQMPTDTLDGVLVAFDLDDTRDTLWLVPCAAPHKPRRHLHIDGADFAHAATHPSGTALIVPRGELFEVPLAIEGTRRVRLTNPPCPSPTWRAELWTPDGLVAKVTCDDTTSRVVLAPSPAGWYPTPYTEVTAIVRAPPPTSTRASTPRAPEALYLGLRHDPRGLLFRSLDHGDTWEALTIEADLAPPSAEDVVVTSRLIAVRTAHSSSNPLGGQVFVSTNRKTFARARSPFGDEPVDRLWLSDRGTLLAGREDIPDALGPPTWRVVESRDLGRTWLPTTAPPPPRSTTLILPDGANLEPGPRGLWKRRPHGSRALVFPR